VFGIYKTPVVLQGTESIIFVTPKSICVIQIHVETKADVSGKRVVIPVFADQVLQVTTFKINISIVII
jgi:hypothetical protein